MRRRLSKYSRISRVLLLSPMGPSLSVEQNLAAGGAAFADAGYINRGPLLKRTREFAGAAANAASGVDAWLFQSFGTAGGVEDVGFFDIDGLGRNRAPLFAHDALGGLGPRQAAAAIVERGAEANRLVVGGDTDHPAFFFGCDLPDGSGGAHLRTEHATRLAVTDARRQHGRPQPFQAGLIERGVQRVVGAHLHALAAANEAGEELVFVERAGRAQEPVVAAFAQPRVGAHQRNRGGSGGEAGQRSPSPQVRRSDLPFLAEEAKRKTVVRARTHAIHAHQAFGL